MPNLSEPQLIAQFELPVYFVQEFKTKKSKAWLCSMNWYRNAHWSLQDKVKVHYDDLVKKILNDALLPESLLSYEVRYTYFYKNINSDTPNVCSLMSKFVNDTLQDMGVIVNDNVQHLKEERFLTGSMSKSNPRCLVQLYKR